MRSAMAGATAADSRMSAQAAAVAMMERRREINGRNPVGGKRKGGDLSHRPQCYSEERPGWRGEPLRPGLSTRTLLVVLLRSEGTSDMAVGEVAVELADGGGGVVVVGVGVAGSGGVNRTTVG